jgi:lipoate-protein ligase A
LGLPAQITTKKNRDTLDQPVCFENPADFEVVVNGKKIIGSAQAQKKEGILQHGTLPLAGDLRRITEVLYFATPAEREQAASTLLEKATTVQIALGKLVSWEEAAQRFQTGFERKLNLEFEKGELTKGELNQAENLVAARYGDSQWTKHIK